MSALLALLLLLRGIIPTVDGFTLCGWRNQSTNGNILRYHGGYGDDMVTVENSAEALTVYAPFPLTSNSSSFALQPLPGMYRFCLHWIPGLQIFNFSHGITIYHVIHTSNGARSDNYTLPNRNQPCNSSNPFINVTINEKRVASNECRYDYNIPVQRRDPKTLEHEFSQVNSYLEKARFEGDGRQFRRWVESALSEVQFDGKSHHFGKGSLQAAVYNLESRDVLKSIPESLDISLSLPSQLLERSQNGTARRLHVVRIQDPSIFQDTSNSSILGDQVFGITLQGTKVSNLAEDIVITFPHEPIQGLASRCVFWDDMSEDWSTAGCRTVPADSHTECRCNHLTYFAVLMQVSSQVISEEHLVSLTALTFAGCAISALSCIFTVMWICWSGNCQRNPTLQIHVNLLMALLLLDLSFIVSALLGALEDVALCRGSAMVLHFSLLCLFSWMAIEGFNLYQLVVKVFDSLDFSSRRVSLLAWAFPILVVLGIFLIDQENYGILYIKVERPSDHNSTAAMCWLTEPIVHQVLNLGFFAVVLLFNLCMLFAMSRRVLRLTAHTRREKVRHCITLLGLSCMLGLSWGLAFFSFGVFYLPVQYIFSILNALQGLFIFLWYWALSQPHAKYSPGSSVSTSGSPGSPRADQTVSTEDTKRLT
ncbi:adhesion G-protein coupled receptor G1-like [Hyperolius riggenbachi]|uniref:adhesion G-protein coupled receptor G1-like n=1 Tax=Hyperolius riggenbachi TaxID=752182 RepID=UPI0035A39721